MLKIKMLKDLKRYNIMGYDTKVFTGKKDEVVEISTQHGNKLIEKGLAVEATETGSEGSGATTTETGSEGSGATTTETGSEGSGAVTTEDSEDYFTLDAKTIASLKEMDKDTIEAILRSYDVEVDKRHSMPAIHKELIETVSKALPEEVVTSDNVVENLIKFYNDKFGILLDKEGYAEDKLSELTEDMGALVEGALSYEDS